jgi:putative NADH-flavin reductase
MQIAVFGASGTIGQRITQEALFRGHQVKAIVRDPARLPLAHPRLTLAVGDILDSARVAQTIVGSDVVVSAIGPAGSESVQVLVDAAHALINSLPQAGVKRLVVVGGAGSLEVAPGIQLVDTPDFPEALKALALAHREALEVYRSAEHLEWTYVSPALFIAPGERTGAYRVALDQLLTNDKGESRISAEDYAVALLDEIEAPRFVRQRFTVAY